MTRPPLAPPPFPYTTLFRSWRALLSGGDVGRLSHAAKPIDVVAETDIGIAGALVVAIPGTAVLGTESPRPTAQHFILTFGDRKSTRLNSSHRTISYAVFCLK